MHKLSKSESVIKEGKLKIKSLRCGIFPKLSKKHCVLYETIFVIYSSRYDTNPEYYFWFECSRIKIAGDSYSRLIELQASNLEILLQAETATEANIWKEQMASRISNCSGGALFKNLESRYYKEPHYILCHFFKTINTLDLLMYKEDGIPRLGMILITTNECSEDGSNPIGIRRDLIYYSSSNQKYVWEPIVSAFRFLRNLQLFRLLNYELERENHQYLKEWLNDLLAIDKPSPSDAVEDIVITPYKALVLAGTNCVEEQHWKPEDLFDTTKVRFKKGIRLDTGHIILDQNNIIL